MGRWSWIPLAVFLALASLLPRVWGESAASNFAERFCSDLVIAETRGTLPTGDEEWRHWLDGLRSSGREKALEVPSGERVTACKSRFGADLEEAAFIVRGMELLEATASKPVQRTEVADAHPLKSLLPGGISVELASASTDLEADGLSLSLLVERRKIYLNLWSEFTRHFKERVSRESVARLGVSNQEISAKIR